MRHRTISSKKLSFFLHTYINNGRHSPPRRGGEWRIAKHPPQNTYFNANCMMRGSLAVVILPNNGLLNAEIGSFMRKEFVRLKASARTSIFFVSWIWNVRERAASSPH